MTLPSGSLSGLAPLLLCLPVMGGRLPLADTEDLYAAEFNNDRISVLDAEGNYLRNFTAPGLDGPQGIAFGPNELIYVGSSLSDEVVVFDRAEQLVTRFSAPELAAPKGLAINDADELLVASADLDRICVFGLDGTFLRWFDAPGLTAPNSITLNSVGNLFVTSSSEAVFEFDAAEQFVGSFTVPAGFILAGPSGIARDVNDDIWVAGSGSHNILRFAPDGTLLSQLKHPDLMGPQGLAFDDSGNLYAAAMLSDSIVEFDASGAWVQTISDPGLHLPQGLAFAPPCPPPVTYCTAGTSASGCQASISTLGSASATKSSGFILFGTSVEGAKDAWFFYGTNGRQATTWGNGTSFLCVTPPVKRGGTMVPTGTAGACNGAFGMDLNARWCATCPKPFHNPGAGAIVQAQLWYRDPLNTSNQTTSMSDAVEFFVCP